MTEPTREQMRADLARAMGITEEQWQHKCKAENHSNDEGFWCYDCCIAIEESPKVAPDPFTSAADKDALVEWICKNIETLRQKFIAELCGMIGLKQNWQLDRYDEYDLMILLTAPLETVALAAWRAIQPK